MARMSTVSLVLVSPSTEMRLKERSTAFLRASRRAGASISRSVVMKASMVAMEGWIMPAPLAAPPILKVPWEVVTSSAVLLGKLSVVMMALEKVSPPWGLMLAARLSMPFCIASMGSGSPITPVEQTRTSSGGTSRAFAVLSTMVQASFNPSSPVQALALPLLAIIALAFPLFICWEETSTGAALTRLVVKTPAARASFVENKRLRSGRSFFIPQAMPPARNPWGAVTPPSIFSSSMIHPLDVLVIVLILQRGER